MSSVGRENGMLITWYLGKPQPSQGKAKDREGKATAKKIRLGSIKPILLNFLTVFDLFVIIFVKKYWTQGHIIPYKYYMTLMIQTKQTFLWTRYVAFWRLLEIVSI